MKVIIFGMGVSGLTVAHYLSDIKNCEIHIYDKDDIAGGMAKSKYYNNIPTEHSWRGYAPFYFNTFRILKSIPIKYKCNQTENKKYTVYDNLTDSNINFYLFMTDKMFRHGLGVGDHKKLKYLFTKFYSCDARRIEFYKMRFIDFIDKYLTKYSHTYLLDYASAPAFGFTKSEVSVGHFAKVIEMTIQEKNEDKTGWTVMNKPTNEAWIDPWVELLTSKGVKFHYNKELEIINYNNNSISNCVFKDGEVISGNEYVLCLNSFNLQEIFLKSNMLIYYYRYLKLNIVNDQISFRIGFNKKLKYPNSVFTFSIIDSHGGITIYSQDSSWCEEYKLKNNLNTLWSGVCVTAYNKSNKYNKPMTSLNMIELKDDILTQIFSCKSFIEFIETHNNFKLSINDITHFEIYDDWYETKNGVASRNKKWVNSCLNEIYRPTQNTQFNNLFIGGAYTQTSTNIWCMESATESGVIVANLIRQKYNIDLIHIFIHEHLKKLKLLQQLDNILYTYGLPHIFDFTYIVVCVILIVIFLKILSRLTCK